MSEDTPHVWVRDLASEEATMRLAADLAPALRAGDLITLSGDLGAGKTAFARALIRHLTGDPFLEVPSPTFTLLQLYDTPRFPIVHADLYRISNPSEMAELGWDEAAEGALVLVEWPGRAGNSLPQDRIDIAFHIGESETASSDDLPRRATVTGFGKWAQKLSRLAAAIYFIDAAGWDRAKRNILQGDASTRSYERLEMDGTTAILMNAPSRLEAVHSRPGKSYNEAALLAQDVKPFVAMALGLIDHGFSAPGVLAMDVEGGFLLLEDLGQEVIVGEGGPIVERYEAAIDTLAALHGMKLPDTLPITETINHTIPSYTRSALQAEVDLLLEWYLPYIRMQHIAQRNKEAFSALWADALAPILAGSKTWVLRDFHSPNLVWLPHRKGIKRIGLLDFQDAVIGSPAYDVASLAMDARVDVSEALELHLISRYVKLRKSTDLRFDPAHFARDYAIMGVQRATKILGIFARLDRRDGKPDYLRHIPRVRAYLERSLAHPALAALKSWYNSTIFMDKRR